MARLNYSFKKRQKELARKKKKEKKRQRKLNKNNDIPEETSDQSQNVKIYWAIGLLGDYTNDENFRKVLQHWPNNLWKEWEEKDQCIKELVIS